MAGRIGSPLRMERPAEVTNQRLFYAPDGYRVSRWGLSVFGWRVIRATSPAVLRGDVAHSIVGRAQWTGALLGNADRSVSSQSLATGATNTTATTWPVWMTVRL